MMRVVSTTCLVLTMLTGGARLAGATPIVVPGSLAAAEGDSNNGYPFNLDLFGVISQRYQQIYSASEFPGAIFIDAILFRPDASASAFSNTLPDVQISLSTSSKTPGTLSGMFAENLGLDEAIVHTGALGLASAFTGPSGGPYDFDIVINLATPFFYDPSLGSLLLDVRNAGGGGTAQFDAVSSSAVTSRLVSVGLDGVNSETGETDGFTLVTAFQFRNANVQENDLAPVPEPASLLLIGTGLSALAARRRRARAR